MTHGLVRLLSPAAQRESGVAEGSIDDPTVLEPPRSGPQGTLLTRIQAAGSGHTKDEIPSCPLAGTFTEGARTPSTSGSARSGLRSAVTTQTPRPSDDFSNKMKLWVPRIPSKPFTWTFHRTVLIARALLS